MKAWFLSFFCAVFLLAFLVEANLQITDSELRYGSSSTHKQEYFSRTLAIRNDFPECILQNINLEFTERNDFRRSNIAINDTSPASLNPSQQGTTLVTINAGDFDLIDEDLEEREEVEIGTLSLRADKFNESANPNCTGQITSSGIPVKLQLKNDLDLLSVEISSDGDSFTTISEDSTKDIILDEDYDLRFKIKNTFDSSSNVELENINIEILSDDLGIDKSTSLSEVLAGQTGEKVTTVSADETGTGEVTVKVIGDDRWGGKHGEIFVFNFRVEEAEEEDPVDENDADGDGVPDNRDECLNTVSVCDVDAVGCPLDSDEDGTCDALDPTPRPAIRQSEDDIDTSSGNEDEDLEEDTERTPKATETTSTAGFIPFLIGFVVGILVTAGFSVLIKS